MTDEIVQTESQGVTEIKGFRPNIDQLKWIDTAIELETDTITEIEAACGINRKQWYRWLQVPGFIDWFNAEWDRRVKGHAWKLDAIGLKNAKRDFNYWKAMQQRTGRLQEEDKSPSQTNIQINVDKYLK